jgi:hypothetical protein
MNGRIAKAPFAAKEIVEIGVFAVGAAAWPPDDQRPNQSCRVAAGLLKVLPVGASWSYWRASRRHATPRRLVDLFKVFLGLSVVRVDVRMNICGQLAIGRANVIGGGVFGATPRTW